MAEFYDTLLGEYIKNPGERGLSLDKLSKSLFSYEMINYKEITSNSKINFKDVDLLLASNYSGEDVYITNKLYEKQKKEKITQNKVLKEIEIPLIEVLKNMEISGVKIDRNKLKEIGIILENEILKLEKEIYKLAEEEFNIKSPKQVGEILFSKLKLPKGKKTKTGWSVNSEVLLNLQNDYKIAKFIVNYRHFSKLLSTYIDGLIKLLDDEDLLHTSYNGAVTTTGRLSSTKPNLQNIPTGSGISGMIREAFISRWGDGKIMAFDYSQVEVRILAILSKDNNLLDAFKNGLDIHKKTAEFIFGEKNITQEERKIAKAVNFGVIYGISPFGLNKMINSGVKQAKIYIDKFYENYPLVRKYLDNTILFAEKNGYVKTLFGRKRYIKGINDRNSLIKKSAEREAINMPIQGTSADIIKIAMIKIDIFIKKSNLKTKMIMQVHDELVFDVYPGEEEILKKEVKNIMESILKDNEIHLKVDIGLAKTWKDAK